MLISSKGQLFLSRFCVIKLLLCREMRGFLIDFLYIHGTILLVTNGDNLFLGDL